MSNPDTNLKPILCAPLLRVVDGRLIELLQSLTPPEWELPTLAPAWRVSDVAAHLLDTALRKLSLLRDGCIAEPVEIRSSQELVALVNRLNREGVAVYRRLSPLLLIEMMQLACEQSARFHESLDPFAPAGFPVSWAGEETSLNWFDTARELTERWHHQQQIRLATNRPGILTPQLYHPVLDCFLRGLPHAFRSVAASDNSTLVVEIAGDCGGNWQLAHRQGSWRLECEPASHPSARIVIPQQIAWRIFTKGIGAAAARAQCVFEGDRELGEQVLTLVAIVA